MTSYLDASALVPLAVDEAVSDRVQAFMERQDEKMVVSEFAAAEAASGVSRLVRMGELDARAATAALDDLDAWRFIATELVDVTAGDLRLAHLLVRRFETKLRAADALHVAIAKRLGARLISRDKGLCEAATMIGLSFVDPAA